MANGFRISAGNRKRIYGVFDGDLRRAVVILAHGLPGNMDDGLLLAASDWFKRHGYAVCRFNFYGPQKDARQLMETSLHDHAADLGRVARYLRRKGAPRVFTVGHSFGALAILETHGEPFDAAAFWDPSYRLSFLGSKGMPAGRYVRELDCYAMPWGTNILLSSKMVDEVGSMDWKRAGTDFRAPLIVATAVDGVLQGAAAYAKNAGAYGKHVSIPHADHVFESSGAKKALFQATDRWFRRNI